MFGLANVVAIVFLPMSFELASTTSALESSVAFLNSKSYQVDEDFRSNGTVSSQIINNGTEKSTYVHSRSSFAHYYNRKNGDGWSEIVCFNRDIGFHIQEFNRSWVLQYALPPDAQKVRERIFSTSAIPCLFCVMQCPLQDFLKEGRYFTASWPLDRHRNLIWGIHRNGAPQSGVIAFRAICRFSESRTKAYLEEAHATFVGDNKYYGSMSKVDARFLNEELDCRASEDIRYLFPNCRNETELIDSKRQELYRINSSMNKDVFIPDDQKIAEYYGFDTSTLQAYLIKEKEQPHETKSESTDNYWLLLIPLFLLALIFWKGRSAK